jgi:hypothetical protein
MLSRYNHLREFVLIASEVVDSPSMPPNYRPLFEKVLNFTFSRQSIVEHHEEIKSDLEEFIRRISEEAGLLSEDQLAAGEILRLVNVTALHRHKETRQWWEIDIASLKSPVGVNDPTEYWATTNWIPTNLLTDTESYPWMPVKVSPDYFPF